MKTYLKKAFALSASCVIVVLSAGIASRSQTTSNQAPQPSRTWAVVIGVSRYPKLPGGQQLQFAERDAAAFADVIKKSGGSAENVRLLLGAEATTNAIKSAIGNWVARSAAESDTVIIFFSGHGLYERDFKQSYLLTFDSDAKDPFASALSLNDIKQALGTRIRSRRVLVLADALRRDLFDPDTDAEASESFIASFKELSESRGGVSAIIASRAGEFSREGQRWGGHGVFAKHLLDSMSGAADRNGDGAITSDELFDLVSARVSEDTSNKQHPWRTDMSEQFVIARVERQLPSSATTAKAEPVAKPQSPARSNQPKPEKDSAITAQQQVKQERQPVVAGATAEKPVASREDQSKPKPEKLNAQTETTPQDSPRPPATSAPIEVTKTVEPTEDKKPSEPQSASASPNRKPPAVAGDKRPETAKKDGSERPSASRATNDPVQTRRVKPPTSVATAAPDTLAINTPNEAGRPIEAPSVKETDASRLPAPPKPRIALPDAGQVNSPPDTPRPGAVAIEVPSEAAGSASNSILMQLEAAIYAKDLLEPRSSSAWELYRRAASDPAMAAGLSRLKPMLAEALVSYGRSIVGGDVRADNITDKVDDFKKAGQVFVRARSLQPASEETVAFEKLSAAQALIALQFYDEAERALSQIQGVKLAALENALGLVYQGKLESFRAERAFKRAIEIDTNWAAPHYNLALLYQSQQNQAALEEFERAADLDKSNAALLVALGDEYFSRQQWQRAADTFRKAIAVKPSDDTLHTKLGHALFSQGLQQEANREYQKARELRGKP